MSLLQLALESHHHAPTIMKSEPSGPGLWFRHESPYHLEVLKPLSYDALQAVRPDYDVPARRKHEDYYRKILTRHSPDMSFLYATIVGYNKMEPALEYPGYTYYFHLTALEIAQCLFDTVSKKSLMWTSKGFGGLKRAMQLWEEHQATLEPFEEKGFGMVDPRVEVIIPFEVRPIAYIPQVEDR